MPKFKVGDIVIILEEREKLRNCNCYGGGVNKGVIYTVSHAVGNAFQVDGDASINGNGCWIRDTFAELQAANPNHIRVSSLDYMQSTTLTEEDKKIIKEYLYENS